MNGYMQRAETFKCFAIQPDTQVKERHRSAYPVQRVATQRLD
jgi:hypothetical protein